MAESVVREKIARTILEILVSYAASNFHFLFLLGQVMAAICLNAYHIRTMWTLCPENIDQVQRPSHVARKTMAVVFFNGTGLHMIDILSQKQKTDPEYLAEHRAYHAIISFDLSSNRKELSTENMRCPF
jgi:hypothetical protein